MKKIVLIPVLCLGIAGYAQVKWGMLAGYQISGIGNYDLITSGQLSSPFAGIMTDIRIPSSSFHILAQVQYTSLGYDESNIQGVDRSGNSMGTIDEHRLRYVKIPVYVLYGGPDKKKNVSINGGLGPFIAFHTGDKLKIRNGDEFGNSTVLPGGVKKITPVVTGLGFQVNADWKTFMIAVHFEQSFNGIYQNQTMGPGWKVHDFGISMGYFFKR
jgi:hypothetical protein